MSEHFVKYINIENYKCFSDFSAEGFKRVNLISGKNNVGKTALLEALTKHPPSTEDQMGIYIGTLGISQRLMIDFFTNIQKKDKESELYEYIQGLDSSIENVKIIGGNSIQCKVIEADGKSHYRDLNEFGDGLRRFLAIIVALFQAESSYVCIDELSNGIHYSSLDQLWEIILTLSKELNVQVFATTHSQECIESYCRVAERLQEQDISFITLVRNKEKAVKAIVRDYEVFTGSIEEQREVRGW